MRPRPMRARAWPAVVFALALPACTNDYETFRFPRQPTASNSRPDSGSPGSTEAGPSTPPTPTAEPDARPPAVRDASNEGGAVLPEAAPPLVPEGGVEAGPSDAALDVTNG